MALHGKGGRPANDYASKRFGKIVGLTRLATGQWRVQATGHRFREADEAKAIERFHSLTAGGTAVIVTHRPAVPMLKGGDLAGASIDIDHEAKRAVIDFTALPSPALGVDEPAVWAWVRRQIDERPDYAAKMLGLTPAALQEQAGTTAALAKLWDAYKADSGKTAKKTVTKTKAAWDRFVGIVKARTVGEIGTEDVKRYKREIENDTTFSDKTRSLVFSRVKAVVNAAAARDGISLGDLPNKMKMLRVEGAELTSTQSAPMSRETFTCLLAAADDRMRALLLVALNCAMYAKEACDLKWAEINMDAGTLVTRRSKTSIIRAAKLWPETVEALRVIRAKRPNAAFVFTSQHGGRWHVEAARKVYSEHRDRLDIDHVPNTEFAAIRDAAYTVSARQGVLQQTLVLAGHKVGGLSDKYIAKNPEFVADACELVRAAYLLPDPEKTAA